MPARRGRRCSAAERGRRTPVLLLSVLSAGAFLCVLAWRSNVLQVLSAGPAPEFPALGNSRVQMEKRQELEATSTQLSAKKGLILQALFDVLQESGIHIFNSEEILQLTQEAMEKMVENGAWLPNWALQTLGATIDAERTSQSYGGAGRQHGWLSPLFSSAKPPETLLQADISPGNCWAFRGSEGDVVIRLPQKIRPSAFTVWHISTAVSPSGEVSSAPREFIVLGMDEDEPPTALGFFVYDIKGEIAQTFHVQAEPHKAFGRILFQVQSKWGNVEHTCIYRVEIHSHL
ncbi:sperm-associated antigen 4 protein-like isoform X2 [Lagopus muta]|uniref:sperm-associated antigen 4 protein-like isoform X2 n=1 Tax=Lagopus muta TaxID=64668 RepID=UPI00209F9251|nr:sperm-associated antigen 4 protein-like isoform X2 [Lagopus muta]